MITPKSMVNNSQTEIVNATTEEANAVRETIHGRFVAAFRLHVGQGRPWSVHMLAEATGMPEPTVKGYHAANNAPGLVNFMLLARELGPGFMNSMLELIGMTGAQWTDADKQSAPGVLAALTEHAAWLANALKDGRLDHLERAAAKKMLPELIAVLAAHNAAL